ncbi:TlpA family protein disulfide reductase [Paenibacillus sp. 1P07SE]|uniref:TlpA family protein disulfide reductase n=1 Tax=Paenibacillus sp. 1P07SE TaxID=3132209 RepID=UPI0039A6EF1C
MKRTWLVIAVLVVLTGVVIYQNVGHQSVIAQQSEDTKPKTGNAAPVLDLPNLEDHPVTVAGERDKLLLLNFWASWCGPCELEAPDLQALHEEHGDRIDLYAINATKYDKERQAREFVDNFGLTFPILMDREGKAVEMYKIGQFPSTLLIDAEGIIRERVTGVISKAEWEQLIDKWS